MAALVLDHQAFYLFLILAMHFYVGLETFNFSGDLREIMSLEAVKGANNYLFRLIECHYSYDLYFS